MAKIKQRPDPATAVVRETFEALRKKSNGFRRSCELTVETSVTLALSQEEEYQRFILWIIAELAKRYVRRGKLRPIPGEKPHLAITPGPTSCISYKVNGGQPSV
ncbi:MAG: hypothetical protein HY473_00705 [Candidatus Sungbacteria bacterium]|uniref:Uncharacterized protein n=1 Tax=Candidatus Sungiibacteriota bacterium TaxID=2750080 RepID=A0A932YYL4_9BACT|nr:hypothetical protein [Candidatus Sungbacteria bacterium]